LRAWLGIAVAIAAGAAFAIANTSAGVAYQAGSNPLTVASTRFLLPTAALIAWLSLTGVSLVLPKRQAFVAILLGAVTALYNWALLRSFNLIPFALAVLIIYLYPLIAAVIVTGFGWDKFAWRTGAAIVVAFIGLAFALDVRGGNLVRLALASHDQELSPPLVAGYEWHQSRDRQAKAAHLLAPPLGLFFISSRLRAADKTWTVFAISKTS
jgi:drug/metabolite transporter (DMT)-like permease